MDRNKTKLLMSWISFMVSMILGITALFIPPTGVIDHSVLLFTAQLLLFVSSLLNLNFKSNVK